MKRITRIAVAAVATAALTLGAAACSSDGDDGEKWRIGLEAPLSGDLEVLGDGMLKGAEMAASEINESGGLLGKEVEIVEIDDAADPDTGVEAANEAISDGLDGAVGPYNSGVGIETLPLYIKAGLTPIRLTSDDSTNGRGFTLQPMTYQIAPVATGAMTDWLDAGSVAIAYDKTEAYTKTEAKAVRQDLEDAGVDVVAYEGIEPGKDDYSAEVEKLAGTGADVAYLVTYYPEGGLIAKEMFDQKVKAKCFADYGAYDNGFIQTAGEEAARNCPVVGVPAPSDFPGSAKFVDAYGTEFDEDPGTWSPYTYDSVNFLAEGVRQANGFDAGKLEKALDGVKGWKGWTGSVTINPKNGTREPGTVVVVRTDASGAFTVDRDWAKAVGAPYGKG